MKNSILIDGLAFLFVHFRKSTLKYIKRLQIFFSPNSAILHGELKKQQQHILGVQSQSNPKMEFEGSGSKSSKLSFR